MLYTIIAGVNGCGKSSFTAALAAADKRLGIIIDADKIALEFQGDKLAGAKAAVRSIKWQIDYHLDITQETTLSGRKTLHTIKKAREQGYEIRMFYIGVSSAEECIKRIKNRVEKGGHDISEELVRRRFANRFNDLIKVIGYCNSVDFFDNENGFVNAGHYSNGALVVSDANKKPRWLSEFIDQWSRSVWKEN